MKPLVGIVMGSASDWDTMKPAAKVLEEFGVAYEAKVFIDCTGDADLVRAAGFPTVKGDVLQPATLWFQLGGVDTDALAYLFGDAEGGMLPVSASIRGRLLELNERGEIPIFGGPWISRFFHDGMVSINLLREATDASDPEWFTRTECSLREKLHLVGLTD